MCSIETIIESYERHQSVWKAGAELGIAGQTVHKKLKRAGYKCKNIVFTKNECAAIAAYYENTPSENFDLSEISHLVDRPRTSVSMVAGRLGLTKRGRMTKKMLLAITSASKGKWDNRPHPRGMLGKKHTPETLKKVSEASKRSWATSKTFGVGHMAPGVRDARSLRLAKMVRGRKPYTRAKGGRRADLGDIHFRSSWEANYARYLNLLKRMGIVEWWEFEPETFWFNGIKRGTLSYMPDFRVKYKNDDKLEYVELKGWVQKKDQTKWRRMKKYHPDIKLVVLKAKEYYALRNKWASSIPEWESDRKTKLPEWR